MRTCPNCKKEVDEANFTCPHCHQRLPRMNKPIVGHASLGDLEKYNERVVVSSEDKFMIRDKNHMSDSSDDSDDMDCAQPYTYVTHENGDRN